MAGGRKRRTRHRSFRVIAEDILTMPLAQGPEAEELEAMGLPANHEYAVLLALVRKARGGDVSAVKLLRELLGEKEEEPEERPVRALELSRLSDGELLALAERVD